MAVYQEKTDTYVYLNELLTYEEMIGEEYKIPKLEEHEFKRFTVEEIANIKSAEVINIVKKYGCSLLVNDNSIQLGEIEINKLLYLDDMVVAEFIYKLIEYALLREELRREKRQKNAPFLILFFERDV